MLFIPLKYFAGSRFDTERTRVINNTLEEGILDKKGYLNVMNIHRNRKSCC